MSLKARWTWLEIESDSDISNIEHWFKLGKEDAEAFPYIVIKLVQHFDFTITRQMNYINSISEISLSKEYAHQWNDQLAEKETKDFRVIDGELDWVSGLSSTDFFVFHLWHYTRFNNSTLVSALRLSKYIKYFKSTDGFIKIPQFNKINSLQMEVLTIYTKVEVK